MAAPGIKALSLLCSQRLIALRSAALWRRNAAALNKPPTAQVMVGPHGLAGSAATTPVSFPGYDIICYVTPRRLRRADANIPTALFRRAGRQ